jgi:site-specific DNA-methyltransferase (adenine-specific)
MKFTYEINKVYWKNWLLASKDCPAVDLVVTSPPYINARNYGAPMFDSAYDWEAFCFLVLDDVRKVLKDSGVIWWNTGSGYENNRKLTNIFHLIITLEERGLYLIDEIPWCKTKFLPKRYSNRPYPAWEHNFIFAKYPDRVAYYVDQVREPYSKASLQRYKYGIQKNLQMNLDGSFDSNKKIMVKPHPLGRMPPNYLILNANHYKKNHPAPMAPELANWAIRAYSKEGDLILDPMCGIGTTCIEAKKLNRNYIGFDINEEYIKNAKKGLESVA